jgi:hypothetical protein
MTRLAAGPTATFVLTKLILAASFANRIARVQSRLYFDIVAPVRLSKLKKKWRFARPEC